MGASKSQNIKPTIILRVLHLLSFDVLVAGFFSCMFAARICSVELSFNHYIILVGSIWCIYTADHLLDSIRSGSTPIISRRSFHNKNFFLIAIILCVMLAIVFYMSVMHLNIKVWIWGMFLASLSFIHLFLSQVKSLKKYPKELVVTCIFCFGIWILPYHLSNRFPIALGVLAFFHLWLSAFMNLVVISIFERKHDVKLEFTSMIQIFGVQKSIRVLQVTSFFAIAISLGIAFIEYKMSNLISLLPFIVIAIWPLFMVARYRRFLKRDRYLFYADKVIWLYMIPAIFFKM